MLICVSDCHTLLLKLLSRHMDSVIVLICANLTVTSYICQLTDPFVILQCFWTIELDGQHF